MLIEDDELGKFSQFIKESSDQLSQKIADLIQEFLVVKYGKIESSADDSDKKHIIFNIINATVLSIVFDQSLYYFRLLDMVCTHDVHQFKEILCEIVSEAEREYRKEVQSKNVCSQGIN